MEVITLLNSVIIIPILSVWPSPPFPLASYWELGGSVPFCHENNPEIPLRPWAVLSLALQPLSHTASTFGKYLEREKYWEFEAGLP